MMPKAQFFSLFFQQKIRYGSGMFLFTVLFESSLIPPATKISAGSQKFLRVENPDRFGLLLAFDGATNAQICEKIKFCKFRN